MNNEEPNGEEEKEATALADEGRRRDAEEDIEEGEEEEEVLDLRGIEGMAAMFLMMHEGEFSGEAEETEDAARPSEEEAEEVEHVRSRPFAKQMKDVRGDVDLLMADATDVHEELDFLRRRTNDLLEETADMRKMLHSKSMDQLQREIKHLKDIVFRQIENPARPVGV